MACVKLRKYCQVREGDIHFLTYRIIQSDPESLPNDCFSNFRLGSSFKIN